MRKASFLSSFFFFNQSLIFQLALFIHDQILSIEPVRYSHTRATTVVLVIGSDEGKEDKKKKKTSEDKRKRESNQIMEMHIQ